uniref:Uncharacterized protein n=1 Tax=Globodera rostochiensis TaxID=31243 RepID=A0A914HTJ2_GLORO
MSYICLMDEMSPGRNDVISLHHGHVLRGQPGSSHIAGTLRTEEVNVGDEFIPVPPACMLAEMSSFLNELNNQYVKAQRREPEAKGAAALAGIQSARLSRPLPALAAYAHYELT